MPVLHCSFLLKTAILWSDANQLEAPCSSSEAARSRGRASNEWRISNHTGSDQPLPWTKQRVQQSDVATANQQENHPRQMQVPAPNGEGLTDPSRAEAATINI
jgi:hypothetical protein